MDRNSRAKSDQFFSGDTIEILQDLIGLPSGFYKVDRVAPPLLHLTVGDFLCGTNIELLGPYRKLSANEACSIDWVSEMARLKRFHKQLEIDPGWEEIIVPDLNDNPDVPLETVVRRPRTH